MAVHRHRKRNHLVCPLCGAFAHEIEFTPLNRPVPVRRPDKSHDMLTPETPELIRKSGVADRLVSRCFDDRLRHPLQACADLCFEPVKQGALVRVHVADCTARSWPGDCPRGQRRPSQGTMSARRPVSTLGRNAVREREPHD